MVVVLCFDVPCISMNYEKGWFLPVFGHDVTSLGSLVCVCVFVHVYALLNPQVYCTYESWEIFKSQNRTLTTSQQFELPQLHKAQFYFWIVAGIYSFHTWVKASTKVLSLFWLFICTAWVWLVVFVTTNCVLLPFSVRSPLERSLITVGQIKV